jgi:leader peptidase (prepilin peptidase) / N-methyltransferase
MTSAESIAPRTAEARGGANDPAGQEVFCLASFGFTSCRCAIKLSRNNLLACRLRNPWRRGESCHVDLIANFSSGMTRWLAPILVAPFIGSFLGVLIVRLPAGKPVAMARSACDHCGHRLGSRDLIPFVSYLLARGRCRYCGEAIGSFPFVIELATLAVAVWAVVAAADAPWVACLFGWTLLTLAWIDLRTMILPDVLTLPLLAFGLIATWINAPDSLADHLLAAVIGYVSLAGVAWTYRRLRGRDGLGMGDAKLLAAIGAFLGLSLLPLALLVAACAGLAAAGVAALTGKRMTAATAIPFGPFLALSGWLLWLYADRITDWLIGGSFGPAVSGWLTGG